MPHGDKPFIATLRDSTRSHIEGQVNGTYYRIERDRPTPVSLAVRNALADSGYDVEIYAGEDQAVANAEKTKEDVNDGNTSDAGNDGSGTAEADGEEDEGQGQAETHDGNTES